MVALVVTAGSLIASRGGAKTPTERSRRTDAAAGAGGTITPAPATPARATARSGGRAPTGVVVRVIDPASVLVSWTPPGERDGLIGYVVVHSASLGTEQPSEHPVNDDEAVEAAVAVPRQGSRCFVVQAVWADRGYPSVAACT
jgi:hypothetical protein